MKRYFLYVIVALMPLELMSEELGRFGKKDFKSPVREFGVIATKSGYFPESMFAYVGEKARFFITSTDDTPQCFLLKDHNVFLSAEKGKMQEAIVEFKYPGRFEYYCPSTKFKGHITVVERPGTKSKVKREIASEKKTYWTPRD